MKLKSIDIAFGSIAVFSTAACVLLSATGGEKVGVVLTAIGLGWITTFFGAWMIDARRRVGRSLIRPVVATIGCIVVIATTAGMHWSLRAVYAWQHDSIDATAERIRRGERVEIPLRLGLVTIRETEISHDDHVCLWTDLALHGRTGFMQCGRDGVPDRMWSAVSLDDRWQYVSED